MSYEPAKLAIATYPDVVFAVAPVVATYWMSVMLGAPELGAPEFGAPEFGAPEFGLPPDGDVATPL